MTGRLALAAVLAAIAAVIPAGAADAANVTVQAVDGVPPTFKYSFAPSDVRIEPGETVTWTFAGTADPHNVAASGGNWTFRSGDASVGHPDASFTFATQGTYSFLCEFHGGMKGTVTVGTPPPPPPPPLSEQPFDNDQPAPTVLEIADESRPALTRVRVARVRAGARVRFRLSEPASVTVRVKRGRRTVKSRRVSARKGTHAVTVGGLRSGTYRVEILARDPAGNRSRLRRARLTIR